MSRKVPIATALVAVLVGSVQFRQGVIPLLDTVTYWSGAKAVARGDFFSTTLAPSFSNFSAIDFLERGGTLPFVDFPIGYPLLAGILGALIGVSRAMQILVLAALAAVAVGVTIGYQFSRHRGVERSPEDSPTGRMSRSVLLGILGVLIVLTPTMRLVTQGALSESLFCAAVLWLVISLARYRHGGSWNSVVALTVTASLLRFLGAPLAVLAGWERYRRTGDALRSFAWSIALMLPAALNIVLASAAGGGHNAGWRGIDRLDIETFVRSLGGWFDARQGDIRRTYFTADGPSWWSWPLAALWVALVVFSVARVLLGGRARRGHRPALPRPQIPAVSELALSAAGIMTVGLVAGIMGFDALVIADNRLMLPSGVLTISALAWWMATSPPGISMSRLRLDSERTQSVLLLSVLVMWMFAAVRPWQATEMFSQSNSRNPLVLTVEELLASPADDVRVVVSNDADAVHWETGIPSVYTPMPVKPLSGETIDEVPLYRDLPCALQRANGVVVISNEATFSAVNRDLLDREVERGTLTARRETATTVYQPTPTACLSQDR